MSDARDLGFLNAARTGTKMWSSALRSSTAPRSAVSSRMPVISSDFGSISAPGNGSTCVLIVAPGT